MGSLENEAEQCFGRVVPIAKRERRTARHQDGSKGYGFVGDARQCPAEDCQDPEFQVAAADRRGQGMQCRLARYAQDGPRNCH